MGATFLLRSGQAAVGETAFALRARGCVVVACADAAEAGVAAGDEAGLEVVVDDIAGDVVAAFDAGGCGEGAVALNEVVGRDASVAFKVVYILGEVCEELVLVLEEANEGVCRGEFLAGGKDVFGDGVKDAGVLAEEMYVKDFLRVGEAKMLQLGVEACVFGAEIGDAEAGGDTSTGENDDVAGRFEEGDSIVDRVVLRELLPLGEFTRDGKFEDWIICVIWQAVEERWRTYAKRRDEFSGGH